MSESWLVRRRKGASSSRTTRTLASWPSELNCPHRAVSSCSDYRARNPRPITGAFSKRWRAAQIGRDTSRSSQTTGFECGLCRVPHRRRRGHDRRAGLPARLPEEHRERGCTSMALEPSSFWRPPARRSALGHHGGKSLGRPDQSAGYLVGMWPVAAVIENPGGDPDYPAPKYQHRVLISETEAIHLDEPVCVDHLIRGEGYDIQIPIGRFLRGPRRLTDKKVRQLRAAAGAEMALMYFKGGGRKNEGKRREERSSGSNQAVRVADHSVVRCLAEVH